jgi:hypothetical protein
VNYGVYGLSLRSAWKLPYPKASRANTLAEVSLRPASTARFAKALRTHPLTSSSSPWIDQQLPDGSTYLRWTNVFDFLIPRDGHTLLCRPLDPRAEEAFHTHLGPSLSYALINLGIEPLHSTTVVIDGGAVALMGDCGYGKSSLGAMFVKAGFPLLTDDLLVLKHDAHSITAYPGAPRVKLYPEIAREIFGARVKGLRLTRLTPKLIIPLDGARAQANPVPLKAIYVLTPPRRRAPSQLRIRRLPARQAFMEIVRNTFNMAITDSARLERQFALASALSSTIPIRSLSYARRFAMLSAARDAILADLADPPQARAAAAKR